MQTALARLRHKAKFYFDLIANERLKRNFLTAFPFWIASLLTGLIAVGYAKLFILSERWGHDLFHGHRWTIFILTPLCFFVGWLLIQKFSYNARGSGIPQVMAAIELSGPKYDKNIDRLLSLRIIVVKIASSLMMVLGGAAIGREGPTIQIAGSVFRKINKWIPASWPRLSGQSFIMTGAAAGLAAAFNTPLGGVVFAIEELSRIHIRFFRTALFSAVIIAGLTAQGLLGPYLYLGYPDISNLRFSIFFGVVLIAIISGLAGGYMSKLILKAMNWRSSLQKQYKVIVFVLFAGLITAAVAYFVNERILGSGKELMATVLFNPDKHVSIGTVFFRIAGVIISFSTGAAGGVFAPSLAAGAGIGAYIAGLFHVIGSNANILILCGMVGFLTGVTRTPFTSAILVLEMTDRHGVIFHLMLAAMFSQMAASIIDKHSFYDHLKKQYFEEAIMEKNIEETVLATTECS